MLEVTNDMDKVLAEPAVVYFTAPWCGPCIQLKPQVARAGTIDNDHQYYIVDVDQIGQEILDEFNISSIPHIFIIKDRKIEKEIVGRKAEIIIEEVKNEL
jgi:thioredoxin-like negative regulator of GroEL